MKERTGVVAVNGNPLTLLGEEMTIGQTAPDFTALDNALQPVSSSAWKGKVVVLAAVPSLDTPVCDMEIRRFNNEAANLGDNVEIVTVSMDLPFAQSRWCGAAGVEKVTTLSDHNMADFGQKYGLLIKELRLLARAVLVVNPEGTVVYSEVLDDISKEPNYDAALGAVRELTA
jgi:thiol peroxidase